MKKSMVLIGCLIASVCAQEPAVDQNIPVITRFMPPCSARPLLYEYPYCLPWMADEIEKSAEVRATPGSFSTSTQLGPLNGVAQDIVFTNSTLHLNVVCGYASQYNPGSNAGSSTAAGLQLSYDMFGVARFDYVAVNFDPTFNPLALGINGIGVGQGVRGQVLTDLGSTARAIKLAVQTEPLVVNQKIYLIGYAYVINSQSIYAGVATNQWEVALVRYNWDGSIDTTFNPTRKSPAPGIPGAGVVTYQLPQGGSMQGLALALQPDKKILITGQAAGQLFVIRYNYNGSLDTTFNAQGPTPGVFMCSVLGYPTAPNTGASVIGADIGYGIALQKVGANTGKIVVAGTGISQQGYRAIILIRLNTDGTLDTSFGPQTTLNPYPGQIVIQKGKVVTQIQGYDDEALALVIQPDDKIIVAGTSLDYSNSMYNIALVRYTADGRLDLPFGPGGTTGFATFTTDGFVSTASRTSLAGKVLLPIKGSTFAAATGVTLQNDGKIVVAGFNNYATSVVNTQQTFVFARYTSAGNLDTQTFNPTGANALTTGTSNPYPQPGVRTVAIQGYNDKAFGIAMQPITPLTPPVPQYLQEEPFAVGSSLNFGTVQAYLAQIYAFSACRLTNGGLVDGTLTVTFTNA